VSAFIDVVAVLIVVLAAVIIAARDAGGTRTGSPPRGATPPTPKPVAKPLTRDDEGPTL
jgi:hypothetical protein